jgi:hypothetical protein
MKTKNTLLIVAVAIANLISLSSAFASDKVVDAEIALETVNNEIENSIKFKVPQIENFEEIVFVNQVNKEEPADRETLEDLTAVPWMIKEVVVRPMIKNVKNSNEIEVTACLAK